LVRAGLTRLSDGTEQATTSQQTVVRSFDTRDVWLRLSFPSESVFYMDMQGKGKRPLPLHSIPKTNVNSKTKNNNKTKTKNKMKVVYTEDLTHPVPSHPWSAL
jgi:hypothetical protein